MIRFALIGAGVLAVTAVVTNAQAPTKTTYDKVYSTAQAERGKKTFGEKCSGCHEPSRFSGDTFHEAWDDKPLKEMELHFIENQFHVLEMAFLRWKRQHGNIRH